MQDEEESPAFNTRARRIAPHEVMLSAVNISNRKLQPKKLAGRKFPLELLCEMANAIMDGDTGELLEYQQLMQRPKYQQIWGKSFGNEIGRLAQGMKGRVTGTNTMFFIPKGNIPQDRFKDVTYGRIVCDF